MEIKLVNPVNPFKLKSDIVNAAEAAGCFVRLKRINELHCVFRFLTNSEGSQDAPFKIQDSAIKNLLTKYPDSTIKTARAIYESLSDYEAQVANRVE